MSYGVTQPTSTADLAQSSSGGPNRQCWLAGNSRGRHGMSNFSPTLAYKSRPKFQKHWKPFLQDSSEIDINTVWPQAPDQIVSYLRGGKCYHNFF